MRLLTRFLVCISSTLLVLLPKNVSRACGFGVWPGEYRFWLMQPNLTNEQDLTPFFFASTYLYHGDQYAGKETYPERNVKEWDDILKGQAGRKDIDSMLNSVDPQVLFDGQKEWARRNSFLRTLESPGHEELKRYFYFSKKVEQLIAHPDPWEEATVTEPFRKLIAEVIQMHQGANLEFVRLRSAYQLEKLYAYSGQDDKVADVYDRWVEPSRTTSWIKTAALYQKAISVDGIQGQYLLSRVFDLGGYRRSHCLVRFRTSSMDKVFPMARNSHERNVIRAMGEFNNPGHSLQTITAIYDSEPTYAELPFLLLREVNKIEDWLVTNKVTGFAQPAVYGSYMAFNTDYADNAGTNRRQDEIYAHRVMALLQRIIKEGKTPQKSLFCLYASHLALLQADLPAAMRYIHQASGKGQLPANIRTQIRIESYLLGLETGFDTVAEKDLMGILNASDKSLGLNDPGLMKDQLILYTARKMIGQGDRARGLMLLSRTRRALGELSIGAYKRVYQEIEDLATEPDFDRMISILDKKDKSYFEKFLVTGSFKNPLQYYHWAEGDSSFQESWDRNRILNVKSTWYLRRHELRKAADVLRQIPEGFWNRSPYKENIGGDPFYLNVYHASSPTKEDKRSLNKRQVVEEMVRLEELAMKDPSRAGSCYFKLANAWYNMSHYGKNWLMVRQWWSVNDMYDMDTDGRTRQFHGDYYGCSVSRQYYQRAMKNTRDKSLKALCYFMIEVCDRNKRRYEWCLANKYEDWRYQDKYRHDARRLEASGVDEDVYRGLIKECELYQSYVNKYCNTW